MLLQFCGKTKHLKKIFLPLLLVVLSLTAQSQIITDTVSIGAGYTNQVWYSLLNDDVSSAPKSNWDLAFDVGGMGSTVLINSITGTQIWNYPNGDTATWNSVDTTGIDTWSARWNSDTSWAFGAIGAYSNLSNPYDLDWGVYNEITHIVSGDSIYILKLSNGSYKKLWIATLTGGVYYFKYANLDGSSLVNATLTKSNHNNQNFGYYSILTNSELSREPASEDWDLLFTQYTTFIPTPYTVTGILQNKEVAVADLRGLPDAPTFNDWFPQTYSNEINTIGYDWKVFTSSFVIEDSLVYFIKAKTGDIWKLIPTGFGGSSNGNFMFTKEKLSSIGFNEELNSGIATMSLYPNPATKNQNISMVYSLEESVGSVQITISDLFGKVMYSENADSSKGLHTVYIHTSDLAAGMYLTTLLVNNQKITSKLLIY